MCFKRFVPLFIIFWGYTKLQTATTPIIIIATCDKFKLNKNIQKLVKLEQNQNI